MFPRHATCMSGRSRIRSCPYTSLATASSTVRTRKRRRERPHRALEPRGIGLRPAESQQRVLVADQILHRGPVLQPDVRQTGSRPRCRHVFAEQALGTARFLPDNRRADITVTRCPRVGEDDEHARAMLLVRPTPNASISPSATEAMITTRDPGRDDERQWEVGQDQAQQQA